MNPIFEDLREQLWAYRYLIKFMALFLVLGPFGVIILEHQGVLEISTLLEYACMFSIGAGIMVLKLHGRIFIKEKKDTT